MKKIIFLIIICSLICFQSEGQECLSGTHCQNFATQYPTTTFSTTSSSWSSVSAYMNAGNWTLFSVTSGYTYEWSYCESFGGMSTAWDAQMTLYEYNNPPNANFLCFSDDYCGTYSTAPYISYTATFTGTVLILTSAYNNSTWCQSNTGSPYNKLVWRRSGSSGCTNWAVSPTSQSVPATGGSYSATVSATGTSCSYNLSFPNSWIVFDNYGSNGVFNYHVTNNIVGSQTGYIYVNDANSGTTNVATLTINQAGASTGTAPTANFSVSQNSINQGGTITTTNNSTGTPTPTYSWTSTPSTGVSFNPSATSTNPSITFANTGSFTITLTATNTNGSNQTSKTITVNGAVPGTANVTGNTTACANTQMTFTVSASNATNYAWSAPGCNPSTQNGTSASFTTTPQNSGNITITATPSNSSGNGTMGSINVTVNPTPITPVISAQGGITSFCQGSGSATLLVTNSCTGCTYNWNPSGSGTSNNVTNAGTYSCTATTPSCGTSASSNSITITTNTIPTALFTYTNNQCNYNFIDNSTNNPISWNWNFNDPNSGSYNTSILQSPQHTFVGTPPFNVSLQVINACGNNTISHTVSCIVGIIELGDSINNDQFSINPNPVKNSAIIKLKLSKKSKISIKLLDLLGKEVLTISEGEFSSGGHSVNFIKPEKLTYGSYLIRFVSDEFSVTRKIIIQ